MDAGKHSLPDLLDEFDDSVISADTGRVMGLKNQPHICRQLRVWNKALCTPEEEGSSYVLCIILQIILVREAQKFLKFQKVASVQI